MDSKPTIEQFIYDCFRERTVASKLRLEVHQVYWRRYYHNDCLWDSRRGVIEMSEAEKIVSVSLSDLGAEVVTTGNALSRSRYHVKSSSGNWLIHEVDGECAHCHVSGVRADCVECGGTGWLSWKGLTWPKRGELRAARTTSSIPEEELGGRLFRDPAIEQFMTDHFRERTTARKKELEIYANYTKRYFSPKGDWARWAPSVQRSDAERVVNIMPVNTGALVFTSGLNIYRLRYHLRPEGQSWLIWEVDTECPICYQQGKSADCFWCGGTIWEHRKGNAGSKRSESPGDAPPR